MRRSPRHGNYCHQATYSCRFSTKNVAGEYGQLRQDFKTSDAPGCYKRIGLDVWKVVSAGTARRSWRDCTGLTIAGGQARSDDHSAPAVGSLGGADQHIAQFAQFGCIGTFVERRGDILRGASDLVNAIRKVSRLVSREHHGISRQRQCGPSFAPSDQSPLFIGPLAARLPTILTAPAHPHFGHVATAPAAWLWVGTAAHACRF
jgi:hypothetical protein